MKTKKVLVSGCYDLLHSGHIAFFKEASSYGNLYVSIGTDKNIQLLKGKAPYFSQGERVYMVNAIKYVHKAFLGSGSGMIDFEPELLHLKPDIFIVNSDGHTPEKEQICKKYNIDYVVLKRIPEEGLHARSSSKTKKELKFPYRICIAGGWIDQPWVSEIHPGSVVVAQIWPTQNFNDRSGMATSSRKVALELWKDQIPEGDPIRNAKLLFGAENSPGTKYISGSQDHIGLLCPGINRLHYDGGYWPSKIDSATDKDICEWLSGVIHLVPLKLRPIGYDPLIKKNLKIEFIKELGQAGIDCWNSILKKDVNGLGIAMTETFKQWRNILPNTVPDWLFKEMQKYSSSPGAITSGCGGGYAMIASKDKIEGSIDIKIRF